MIHDYTHGTNDVGWAITSFETMDSNTVKVMAFGFHVKAGDEAAVSMPDGVALYKILSLELCMDPYDLYNAVFEYVQHLTGWPIVGQTKEQNVRSMEWSKKSSK